MAPAPQSLTIALPAWLAEVAAPGAHAGDDAGRMALAVALARRNVREGGGPFGAAVFDEDDGRLVAAGVNLVLSAGLSCLHAEVVALSLAQRAVGGWDLRAAGRLGLYTSVAPCAMCFGALPWAGVRRLACGARTADAEAIGFDEGDKPQNWRARLEARGIEVIEDLERDAAVAVLDAYRRGAGTVYGPGADG